MSSVAAQMPKYDASSENPSAWLVSMPLLVASSENFTAIGAFSEVTLAWFDWQKRDYLKIPVNEQVEVLMLAGDVSLKPDGGPQVHAHVVLGRSDTTARGGHLLDAAVRPTLELIVETAAEVWGS